MMQFFYEKYCQIYHPEIYANWKEQFSKFKKTCFDFYARGREKTTVYQNIDVTKPCKSIETTWSQLNFFRWCIESDSFKYFLLSKNDRNQQLCLAKIRSAQKEWQLAMDNKSIQQNTKKEMTSLPVIIPNPSPYDCTKRKPAHDHDKVTSTRRVIDNNTSLHKIIYQKQCIPFENETTMRMLA
jgi:hypothetical protein